MNNENENWTDLVVRAIFEPEVYNAFFCFDSKIMAGKWQTNTLVNRYEFYQVVRKLSMLLEKGERERLFKELFRWAGFTKRVRQSKVILNQKEIKQLAENPLITIGAHTVGHLFLASLSEEEMRYEIARPKEQLEEITGKRISFFAYPFGDMSHATDNMVRDCGFSGAFTSNPGEINEETDLFKIPRYGVRNYSRQGFEEFIETCVFGYKKVPDDPHLSSHYVGYVKDDTSLKNSDLKIIIWGAGRIGQALYSQLERLGMNKIVVAFADNDETKISKEVNGLPVLGYEEIAGKYGDKACFLLTGWYANDVFKELVKKKCKNIHVLL